MRPVMFGNRKKAKHLKLSNFCSDSRPHLPTSPPGCFSFSQTKQTRKQRFECHASKTQCETLLPPPPTFAFQREEATGSSGADPPSKVLMATLKLPSTSGFYSWQSKAQSMSRNLLSHWWCRLGTRSTVTTSNGTLGPGPETKERCPTSHSQEVARALVTFSESHVRLPGRRRAGPRLLPVALESFAGRLPGDPGRAGTGCFG